MPKTIEELRKIINEQEAALIIKAQQQRLNQTEQAKMEALRARLIDEEGMDEIPSVDILQKMYKKPMAPFEIQSSRTKAIDKIFENFAKEFGQENIDGNRLNFPNMAKANEFFQKQAAEGHAFLAQEINKDNYAFSDGHGHYKMGSQAEIISYCKENFIKAPHFEMADEPSSSMRPH